MALLDLTGKAMRKPTPYQFHQAYSILYYRPKDSPLREEIDNLWKRREEQEVIDLLSPFTKLDKPTADTRLNFHNTAMRWKCSLVTEEERQEMEEWIASSVLGKEEDILKPWKAEEGDNEQSMENEFIQRYVFPSLSKVLP